jgi:hypothetical protein
MIPPMHIVMEIPLECLDIPLMLSAQSTSPDHIRRKPHARRHVGSLDLSPENHSDHCFNPAHRIETRLSQIQDRSLGQRNDLQTL